MHLKEKLGFILKLKLSCCAGALVLIFTASRADPTILALESGRFEIAFIAAEKQKLTWFCYKFRFPKINVKIIETDQVFNLSAKLTDCKSLTSIKFHNFFRKLVVIVRDHCVEMRCKETAGQDSFEVKQGTSD